MAPTRYSRRNNSWCEACFMWIKWCRLQWLQVEQTKHAGVLLHYSRDLCHYRSSMISPGLARIVSKLGRSQSFPATGSPFWISLRVADFLDTSWYIYIEILWQFYYFLGKIWRDFWKHLRHRGTWGPCSKIPCEWMTFFTLVFTHDFSGNT